MVCPIFVNHVYSCVCKMHLYGPYSNVFDRNVVQYIGLPLLNLKHILCGEPNVSTRKSHNVVVSGHQESWSPECSENKVVNLFDKNVGFVIDKSQLVDLPCNTPLDMDDPTAYLKVVDRVLASKLPNYRKVRIPLPSGFNWDYIEQHIQDYHDKIILDYIKFGFPLNIDNNCPIKSNAQDNHASAKAYAGAVSQFIQEELDHKALFGPFSTSPHPAFTWAPLMTRPKGSGRRVILDLSYGDHSVNKATHKDSFDGSPFALKLPSLDHLIPDLEKWGSNARLFKLDISRAFRNVRVDPGDAIHLGMKWQDKYYIDKNLAFGAVHGTAIFERISDLIRFILAKQSIKVWNYIDDIYAVSHRDTADAAYETLISVVKNIGLPINVEKLFSPTVELSILGILVNVNTRTFSIPPAKLCETSLVCRQMLLRDQMSKNELQSLLGRLLYISRCVWGSRIFLNRMLQLLRDYHHVTQIPLSRDFHHDLLWFMRLLKTFNGVVVFRRSKVAQTVYVDATLTRIGGIWGSRAYTAEIPSDIASQVSISHLEMYNIVIAMRLWAQHWENAVICVKCDNESAVSACNSGKTRDTFLNLCLYELWLVISKYNIDLRVSHIKGKDNTIADALSRNRIQQVGTVTWESITENLLSISF